MTHTHVDVARSDVVGSLLRPSYLREARQGVREGRVSAAALHEVEDRAVREVIALQESVGLDVISDGELRRQSWVVTIPLREEGASHAPLAGYEFLPALVLRAPSTSVAATLPVAAGWPMAGMSASPARSFPGCRTTTGCCWSTTPHGQGTSVRCNTSVRRRWRYSGC